ncbi:MAG: hypothetical protein ACK4OE_15005 [Acidovorax sp.]|uniref:hypothetical protein n=1 Tax=Acidovorax sp. TaxID=1872122 RepID=UPI00391CCB69
MTRVWNSTRWKFAARIAAWHALLSLMIAVLAAFWVFKVWYAAPFGEMLGVSTLVAVLIAVDVVCGPLLNFYLSNPTKTRRALLVDWTAVGVIQLGALVYGMHALWEARPVMVVFEDDRLVVVTAVEIDEAELSRALPEFQKLPPTGIQLAAVRQPKDADERLQSLEFSLQGVEPSARPSWWIPYSQAENTIRYRAKPLLDLAARGTLTTEVLARKTDDIGIHKRDLIYLPITSKITKEWVAVLDSKTLYPIRYIAVDGF